MDSVKNRTGGCLGCGQVKNPTASCLCLHSLSEAKFRSNGLIREMEEVSGKGGIKAVSQLLLIVLRSPDRKNNTEQKNKKSV